MIVGRREPGGSGAEHLVDLRLERGLGHRLGRGELLHQEALGLVEEAALAKGEVLVELEAVHVAKDLRDFYGPQVFNTVVPRNVRLAEAPSFGKPIALYDPRSKGAESYIALAKEIVNHG